MQNIYITTPIYYVNGEPHIGHFYTSLASDILIRLYKKHNFNVRYLTGTDEHGQKVQKSATNNNITPKEFCDKVSQKFRQMHIDFDLIQSYNNFNQGDSFIRTTDKKHIDYVQQVWIKLEQNGWIYKGKYSGWYSIRDETFFTESELVNGKAPTGADVVKQEEECYFFKLSLFQDDLYQMYNENNILQPNSALKEILSFLNKENGNKLSDLCISRTKKTFDWGIEVPTDKNHTIYVWIDALFNYFSAVGGNNTDEFKQYWLNGFPIHIMGKEIVRFHSVYWESLIYGLYHKADEKIKVEELKKVSPKQIFAHGWWVKDGEKMSKSLGNVVNPYDEVEWLQKSNISKEVAIDYFKYFLIASMPFGNDGDYSRQKLIELVNAHLVNNIGNLTQRVASMLVKNFNDRCDKIDKKFEKMTFIDDVKNINFTNIINSIISTATQLNKEFDNAEPWVLIKGNNEDKEKAFLILSSFVPKILSIVDAIEPFCPNISKLLMQNLQLLDMPKIICNRLQNIK